MNILFFFRIVLLVFFGVALSNIFHMHVEDVFAIEKPIGSILFQEGYSLSAAWMFVSALGFILCQGIYRVKCPEGDKAPHPFRQYVLFGLFALFSIIALSTFILSIVPVFEAKWSFPPFLRHLVSVVFFALGACHMLVERNYLAFAASATYNRILIGATLLGTLLGGWMFFHNAPPKAIPIVKVDMSRLKTIKSVEGEVRSYYRKHKSVPPSLKALMNEGYGDKDLRWALRKEGVFSYTGSGNTFEVCTELRSKKSLFKRYRGWDHRDVNYESGRRCQKNRLSLKLVRDKNGKVLRTDVVTFKSFKGNLFTR